MAPHGERDTLAPMKDSHLPALAISAVLAAAPVHAQVNVTGLLDRPATMSMFHSVLLPQPATNTFQPPVEFAEGVPLDLDWSPPGISAGCGMTGTITRMAPDAVTAQLVFVAGSPITSWPVMSSGQLSGSLLVTFTAATPVVGALVLDGSLGLSYGIASGSLSLDVGDDGIADYSLSGSSCGICMPPQWSTHVVLGPTPLLVRLTFQGSASDGASASLAARLRFAPGLLGTWTEFGAGCTAPGFLAPGLHAAGTPARGVPFVLTLDRLPPTALNVAFLVLGFSDQMSAGRPLPLDLTPFGLTGCLQYIDSVPWSTLVQNQGGFGTAAIPMPANVMLPELGVGFFLQAVVLVPGANPFGGFTTNAGHGVIGW